MGSHSGTTTEVKSWATREPAAVRRFTPCRGQTALPPSFLNSERALSRRALTTLAKLLGQWAVLTAQPNTERFGRTACSPTSAYCREILAAPLSATTAEA